jgi:limonene-1,2-epoxide hydrolase
MNNEQIARAFSGHSFEETFHRLTPDSTWDLVGQTRLHGRDAIIATCRETEQELAHVETTWLKFVSTGIGEVVAVHAMGRYAGPDGISTVSSCDLFEFDGQQIATITSFTVELLDDTPAVDA